MPDVDMVRFLRPTQSPVIFMQQLGRGLRRAKGKLFLTVLDFIGNYNQAGNTPGLLTGYNRGTRGIDLNSDDSDIYREKGACPPQQ